MVDRCEDSKLMKDSTALSVHIQSFKLFTTADVTKLKLPIVIVVISIVLCLFCC